MTHTKSPTRRSADAAPNPGTCRVRCQFPYAAGPRSGAATAGPHGSLGQRSLRVEAWEPHPHELPVLRDPERFGPMQALRLGAVGTACAALVGCAGLTPPQPVQSLTFAPVLRMDGGTWTPDGAYAAGKQALAQGRTHEALMLFERAAVLRPNWDDPVNGQVVTLARLGRTADAIAVARKAIVAGARAAELHGNLGLMLMRSGRPDEAWASLEQASRTDPDNTTWTVALARRPAAAPSNLAQQAAQPALVAVAAPVVPVAPVVSVPQAAPVAVAVVPVAVAAVAQPVPAPAVVAQAPAHAAASPAISAPVVVAERPAPAVVAVLAPAAPVAALASIVQVEPAALVAQAVPVAQVTQVPQVAPLAQVAQIAQIAPSARIAQLAPAAQVAQATPVLPAAPAPDIVAAPTVVLASPLLRWDRSESNVLALRMDTAPTLAVAMPTPAEMPKPIQLADASQAAPRLRFHIEVSNGAGQRGLAKGTANALRVAGAQPWRITNHSNFKVAQTEVQYRSAKEAPAARLLARKLGVSVALVQNPNMHASVDVRVVLGKDLASLPANKRLLAEGPEQLELFTG